MAVLILTCCKLEPITQSRRKQARWNMPGLRRAELDRPVRRVGWDWQALVAEAEERIALSLVALLQYRWFPFPPFRKPSAHRWLYACAGPWRREPGSQ